MDKEKQIEEMAKDIVIFDRECVRYCNSVKCKDCHYFYQKEDCYMRRVAEKLVDKGYRKASDVAREIFEEIEKIVAKEIHRCDSMRDREKDASDMIYWEGGRHSLQQVRYWFAELKKKFTEGEG